MIKKENGGKHCVVALGGSDKMDSFLVQTKFSSILMNNYGVIYGTINKKCVTVCDFKGGFKGHLWILIW